MKLVGVLRRTRGSSWLTGKQDKNSLPALAKVHSSREQQDFQTGVQRIDAMIEELAQRTRLLGASPTDIDQYRLPRGQTSSTYA